MIDADRKGQEKQAKKSLAWIGVASIVMLFAGLTSAYIVLQNDYYWVQTKLPQMFGISTAIIVVSSLTMWWATRSAKAQNKPSLKIAIVLTLALGLSFSFTQYLGWGQLMQEGRYFVGHVSDLKGTYGEDYLIFRHDLPLIYEDGNYYAPNDLALARPLNQKVDAAFNVSSSFLYVISGLHLLHLIGGLLALLYTFYAAFRGRYTSGDSSGLEVAAIYWHFLGILWVYLYLFFLLIR